MGRKNKKDLNADNSGLNVDDDAEVDLRLEETKQKEGKSFQTILGDS